jgi:hypothetical protein
MEVEKRRNVRVPWPQEGVLIISDGTVRMLSCHGLVSKVLRAHLQLVLLEHFPPRSSLPKTGNFGQGAVHFQANTVTRQSSTKSTLQRHLQALTLQVYFSISTLLRPSQRLPLAKRTQTPFSLHRRGTTLL